MITEIETLEKNFKDVKSQKDSIQKELYIKKLEGLCENALATAKQYKCNFIKAENRLDKALDKLIQLQENQRYKK